MIPSSQTIPPPNKLAVEEQAVRRPEPSHRHEQNQLKVNEDMASLLDNLLLDDNYSIESLIERAQDRNLNLRELRDQLIKHQQSLQQTSLELFNNSYDRFFKLSHLIACLAEPIKHVIQPVQNYRNQLGQLCQSHDHYLSDIDKKLAALEEISRNKSLAELLIALIRRRDRIFEQIHRIEWLKYPTIETIFLFGQPDQQLSAASNTLESVAFMVNSDSIERVYIELHYLLCEVGAIQPTSDELLSIRKTLESSVLEQQRRLGQWFADTFYHAIQAQDKTFMSFILRTYQQRGDFKELDAVWRQQVVRPYLNILLEQDLRTAEQLKQTCCLLKQFLDKHSDLIQQQPFVVRSFWAEVTDSLDRLKQIYASVDIRTFKERYELMRVFLEQQDDCQPNMGRILNKFDLQGYFNQKSTEIRTSIEASLMQQPLSELPPPSNREFDLKICLQIYQLVSKCWSSEIYIGALESNFTQLTCRVLEKFAHWLSRLSLSDFRIVGTSATSDKTTNFLARQDAIMRLLIDDCTKLMHRIGQLQVPETTTTTTSQVADTDDPPPKSAPSPRTEALSQGLAAVKSGLDNVRNLQKLLER